MIGCSTSPWREPGTPESSPKPKKRPNNAIQLNPLSSGIGAVVWKRDVLWKAPLKIAKKSWNGCAKRPVSDISGRSWPAPLRTTRACRRSLSSWWSIRCRTVRSRCFLALRQLCVWCSDNICYSGYFRLWFSPSPWWTRCPFCSSHLTD